MKPILADRPIAVLSWAAAILLAGGWAATRVPVEWVPRVELHEVNVQAYWFGGSPRQVERYVTAPIERAVQTVPGVEHIRSYSQEGSATIILEVAEEADLGSFVAQVNEQLQVVRAVLPERVFPRLTKSIPEELRDQQGFLILQLIGPQDADVLRAFAEREIQPRLSSIHGVAEVAVQGGTERELRIELDPDRLATYGVGPNDVRQAIFDANRDLTFGTFKAPGIARLAYSPPVAQIADLASAPVRARRNMEPIRLDDVADVVLGDAPLGSVSRIDGQPVVTITIDRARGSDLLEVAALVRERVDEMGESIPAGARLVVAVDRSESVRDQFESLVVQGGIGLLLVVLVLLFMLRSLRAVLVVVFSVGVAIAVAYLLFLPLGLTVNMITVAGMVLVFGLLVDNAVVVVEQFMLRKDPYEALAAVWLPLLGGTLTTMVVLIPLVYLSGELRKLFVPFGVLVSVTLLASLVTAAVIVPVASRYLPRQHQAAGRPWKRLGRIVAAPYRWCARFPKTTLILFALLIGLPFWKMPTRIGAPADGAERARPVQRLVSLYNSVQQRDAMIVAREKIDPALGGVLRKFFRETTFGTPWSFGRREEVRVYLGFPPGNPVERADSLIRPFEAIALASPSVEQTIVRVTDQSATLTVSFPDEWLLRAEPYVMRERLIKRATLLGGIRVTVSGLVQDGYYSGGSYNTSGQRLVAYGPNLEELEALTDRFSAFLKRRSRRVRAVHASSSSLYGREEREVVRIDWRATQHIEAGATASDLAGVLRPVFSSQTRAFEFPTASGDLMPGRIIVRNAESVQLGRLIARPLTVSDSLQVRLDAYTTPTMITRPSAVEREDQQYKMYLSVDFIGPYQLANNFIEESLAAFRAPSGYRIGRDSRSFFTEETQRSLLGLIAGTILLVFLITAVVFESWRLPILVLLSVPTALVGVAAAFLVSGATFSHGAFIGCVLLAGVAANDSILLGHRYQHLRRTHPGRNRRHMVRIAVRERLRPMWTTTLTSAAAMLPLIVLASDSDFWLGLALVVTGGLLASTTLAPLVTVALVSLGKRPLA